MLRRNAVHSRVSPTIWLIAWVLLVMAFAPRALRINEVLDVGARLNDSESTHVDDLLIHDFKSPFARYAALLIRNAEPTSEMGRQLLSLVHAKLEAVDGVIRVASYLTRNDSMLIGKDSSVAIVAVGYAHDLPPGEMIENLRQATRQLSAELSGEYGDVQFGWTGHDFLNHDLRSVSARDTRIAEVRALPLTALLLVFVFGSIAAAGMAIASGVAAIIIALGLAHLFATTISLSILLQNMISMLGLGLGIDYGLLFISRYVESARERKTPEEAVANAASRAGRTIIVSGISVAIGFLALTFVPVQELSSIAIGGLLVVLVSILTATCMLPSLLRVVGGLVRLRVKPWRGRISDRMARYWEAWGGFVWDHPWTVLIVAGLPVAALSLQATRMTVGIPRSDWLPRQVESVIALNTLDDIGRAALLQTFRVLVELPEEVDALSPAGWNAIRAISGALTSNPHIVATRSFSDPDASRPPSRLHFLGIPRHVKQTYIREDREAVMIEGLTSSEVSPRDLVAEVPKVRADIAATLSDLPGVRVYVGGLPALRSDYDKAVRGTFLPLVLFVVTGTLLALVVAFRSLLIPVKAVVLNIVSVAAAFGAVVLVFQDGIAIGLFGMEGSSGGVFSIVPSLVFCIVFGLSMDYEIFLLSRIVEFRRAGYTDRDALVRALSRSAPVITSAAAIMIIVFGAFAMGEFLVMKILGFSLAAAVFIDATVIRMAIGPALFAIAGRWNWWPSNFNSAEVDR